RRIDWPLRARRAAQAALPGAARRGAGADREDRRRARRQGHVGRAVRRRLRLDRPMGLVLADDLLARSLQRIQGEIDEAFDHLLPVPDDGRERLVLAMRHAAIGGGKRVRPLLLVTTAEMYGASRSAALRAGCAVEAIHAYSLVHDDLPGMGDDDPRPGQPTAAP